MIEVLIKPDGSTEVKVSGVSGAGCTDASKFLEKLGKVEKDVPTAEMYEPPQDQGVKQHGQ